LGQDAGSSEFSIKLTLGLSCILSGGESHCWPYVDNDVACSAGSTRDRGRLRRNWSFKQLSAGADTGGMQGMHPPHQTKTSVEMTLDLIKSSPKIFLYCTVHYLVAKDAKN